MLFCPRKIDAIVFIFMEARVANPEARGASNENKNEDDMLSCMLLVESSRESRNFRRNFLVVSTESIIKTNKSTVYL